MPKPIEPTAKDLANALRTCNNKKGSRCSQCPVFSKYGYPRECKRTVDLKAADMLEAAVPLFINGYPVADLEFAAKLMNSAGLTPDDLRKCIDNIEYVVKLVYSDLHNAMSKTAAEFAARMLNHSAPDFTVPRHRAKLGGENKGDAATDSD